MRYLFFTALILITLNVGAQNTRPKDSVANGVTYTYVDQMPQTGYSLSEYLSDNLHYPKSARKANIEGRVVIKFVVNEDGSISRCEVVSGIGDACDKEALRVVKNMPPWKPGKQNGKYVKVYFKLPIVFKLED